MKAIPKYIVVVGTSAGGIRALEEFVMQLTPEIDASFFIVLHLSRKGVGEFLFRRLQQFSQLPCKIAVDKEVINRGHVYIAPPDNHMLLSNDHIIIARGAPENRWRPSVNNLFRSAAATYSSRVIGVILTGLLDDGTSGMASIQRAGGLTMVQDPNEADYPDMPLSVLNTIDVDHCISLSDMGSVLSDIIAHKEPQEVEVPADIILEAQLDQRVAGRIDTLAHLERFDVSCPDCGGGLWVTQKEKPSHYRCHVGHSFTDRELLIRVSEVMENTFWTSLRMMEERRHLLIQFAQKDEERGYKSSAQNNYKSADEMEVHINNLKQILFFTTQVD